MIASPYTYGPKMAKIMRFLKAYKRIITLSLIFAFCAYPLIDPDKFERIRVASRVIRVMLIASQFFWIRRVLDLGERFIPGRPRRAWLAVIAGAVYLFFFVYSFTHMGVANLTRMGHLIVIGAADLRLRSI